MANHRRELGEGQGGWDGFVRSVLNDMCNGVEDGGLDGGGHVVLGVMAPAVGPVGNVDMVGELSGPGDAWWSRPSGRRLGLPGEPIFMMRNAAVASGRAGA